MICLPGRTGCSSTSGGGVVSASTHSGGRDVACCDVVVVGVRGSGSSGFFAGILGLFLVLAGLGRCGRMSKVGTVFRTEISDWTLRRARDLTKFAKKQHKTING